MSSITVKSIAFALAFTAASALPSPVDVQRRDTPQTAYIDVSVATVWTDSSKPRIPLDTPGITNPADIQGWLNSMTLDDYLDLSGSDRTQTQALYGSPVYILSSVNGGYEVAIPDQATPKNSFGYPGWVPSAQVSFDTTYGDLQSSQPFALVNKAATTLLYRDPELNYPFMNISYDTRLPFMKHHGQAFELAVPSGGSAYVSKDDVTVFNKVSDIPYPSASDIVNAANLFLGRPYFWGGTSGFAYDCSGFTHTLYHAHGVVIPRDADAQADFTGHGTPVDKSDLKPADLLFYASNTSDASTIYHVAMYVGNGQMAEAYDSGTPVRITSVRFNEDYWGAERFLTD